MKTILLTLIITFAIVLPAAFGQDSDNRSSKRKSLQPKRVFQKNQLDAVVGFGVVPTFMMDKGTVHVFPMHIGVTWLVGSKFGLDLMAGHSVTETAPKQLTAETKASWTNSFFFLGLRPAIHFTQRNNLDFYGGFSMGIHVSNISGKTNGRYEYMKEMEGHLGIKSGVKPAFCGFVGTRYAFTPKWTAFSEISFGVSLVSIGAGYRFL